MRRPRRDDFRLSWSSPLVDAIVGFVSPALLFGALVAGYWIGSL